jgi:hypothetical protein
LEQHHLPDRHPGRTLERRVKLLSLDNLDARFKATRAVFELERQMFDDLGGEADLSAAQRALCRRAAVLAAVIENEEARWCSGEAIDLPQVLAATNCLRRVLETLGIKRQARRVPSLDDWLRERQARQAEHGEDDA